MAHRVLVAFVDALGPRQVDELGSPFQGLPFRRQLRGDLGYSSGALASVLTGARPEAHGRMCLFSSVRGDKPGPLAPLAWLGLLPRLLHERGLFRRHVAKWFARAKQFEGYFALHRIPPKVFDWLDVEEREDLFQCERVGDATTFLARARTAGLRVYASPWQLPESERWAHARDAVRAEPPDLTFVYAAALDGALHAEGNGSQKAKRALSSTADELERIREQLSRGANDVTTIVVGDHGMADIHRVVDPSPLTHAVHGVRCFVDSTMLRFWGTPSALDCVKALAARHCPSASFLDATGLAREGVPMRGTPYGQAIVVLPEGELFSPSFVGGVARGMHGYASSSRSARAALLSDARIDDDVRRLSDVARIVESSLGLAA